MSDEQTPGSGSRWEPAQPPQVDDEAPTTVTPTDRRSRFAGLRSRTGLAAGAAGLGLALVAGVGGFALGHVSADPGDRVGLVGEDAPGNGDGRFHAPPAPPPGSAPDRAPDDDGDQHGSLDDDDDSSTT